MTKEFSRSTQDYLKQIFELSDHGTPASTNDLAARLKIAPASVTGMVQKLATAKPPLVDYRKRQGVTLTETGQRAALEVIRHHRLLESWLVQSLGYTWDEVHEEACRLEHVISEDFEARIAAALGHPTHDPHGDPIPDADLDLPNEQVQPLSSLRPVQQAVIQRVNDENPEFLRHLEKIGLTLGTQLTVKAYSPIDNNLTLSVVGYPSSVVGLAITSKIFVEISA